MHTLSILVIGAVIAGSLYMGIDYREEQFQKSLEKRVSEEIKESIKQHAITHTYPPYPERVEDAVRMKSKVYYQNKRTVQYQLSTMTPCNPRISGCV